MNNKYIFFCDPRRCIGCGTCLAACMMNHDSVAGYPIPRMNLVKTRAATAPVSCHHCIDAPCMASCPADVFYREGDIVKYNKSKCIGCGNCVIACPFGAVDVIPTTETIYASGKKFDIPGKLEVLKCDLCDGKEGGPSCIKACPTNALVCIDEDVIKESIKKKQIAAAETASMASIGTCTASK